MLISFQDQKSGVVLRPINSDSRPRERREIQTEHVKKQATVAALPDHVSQATGLNEILGLMKEEQKSWYPRE
jgi:hypothetical protein